MPSATGAAVTRNRERQQNVLDRRAGEGRRQIERRVANYVEVLHGLRSLFALHSPGSGRSALSAAEFTDFVDFGRLSRRYPGTLAVSFNRAVPAGRVDAFEAEVRTRPAASPHFRVHPETGTTDPRVVVDYIEPPEGNGAALGYDVTSDPVRRLAVEEARDTGSAIATAPIHLVQDTDAQPALLLAGGCGDAGAGDGAAPKIGFVLVGRPDDLGYN